MSNNYTMFSTALEISNPDTTRKRLDALFQEANAYVLGSNPDAPVPEWLGATSPEWVEYERQNIQVCSEDDENSPFVNVGRPFLWVHSDESADLDVLGCLLKELIRLEPDPENGDALMWTVPYSKSSDGERLDEFGGGAIIVTRDSYEIWDMVCFLDRVKSTVGEESFIELITT